MDDPGRIVATGRILRDYTPDASRRGEDIVRTAWRHAGPVVSRPLRESEATARAKFLVG